MKEIVLTQGKVTKVSDCDYEAVSSFGKWQFGRYAHCSRRVNGKQRSVSMHRFLMNPPEGKMVDHINGDSLDNRRENLRICDSSENAANMSPRIGLTSVYKGVSWDKSKGKWKADIRCRDKKLSLGRFSSEVDAAKVYNSKAKELFGEFARLNDV
jgi:hypothetical protein